MPRFLQLHLLTSYPPSNLNRDDTGQPKTAMLGGVQRLRISSQSLKRAWRTSETFARGLGDARIGERTKLLGVHAHKQFLSGGIPEKKAAAWATEIAKVYGAVKKDKPLEIEQLVHISAEEKETLDALIRTVISADRPPTQAELDGLLHGQKAVDIAMFGRMLAAKTQFNGEAAVQVAHAIGVHASPIEDDYFTAVDDLNTTDSGAAHIGESGFAAAVFYQYICVDRALLLENLDGDEALAAHALRALTEAVLKVSPGGKQNSFASRAYAHFALAEKGDQQPRSLVLAFLRPVTGNSYGEAAAAELEELLENMDKVYGPCSDNRERFNVLKGEGSSQALIDFAAEA